ncbi:MAG: cellulase family glycosylhydrolase [Saccharofermentans sp.]|nr:cellulase family glycosylhydrolase [Saccharofermentans sp.]
MKRSQRRIITSVTAAVLLFIFAAPSMMRSEAAQEVYTARPSVNGNLHVENGKLTDENGEQVQLRGVSTHGLTWYPEYINEELFAQVSQDWNCNLVRLAMYADLYCGGQKELSLEMLHQGIEYAIEADMYVLVDWHMLEEKDPNVNADAACDFFEMISAEYSDCPNIIYEICNEPNGPTFWGDVVNYSNRVIPIIRNNDPDSVIVVGTPGYDTDLGDPYMTPLQFDNVMYVLHFYTATHHEELFESLKSAVDSGLPVFISECGLCEASGDGVIDLDWASTWFSYLNEQKISYAIWSLSDKDESSAFFESEYVPGEPITDDMLTEVGIWVRALVRGEDPTAIYKPAGLIAPQKIDRIRGLVMLSLGSGGLDEEHSWPFLAAVAAGVILVFSLISAAVIAVGRRKNHTYDDIAGPDPDEKKDLSYYLARVCIIVSMFCTIVYLSWRIRWSIPAGSGVVAIAANIILLVVEVLGFIESMILFRNLLGKRNYKLPKIPDDAWPEVDVFIATYNEPCELLGRTINGCKHMKYPDPSKVHIWICDDNRRSNMRDLAKKMGVGYFDRPDNKGAKAGNLNNAMAHTSAPYVVTFDADMIPRSEFLLKTIPYFVDAKLRQKDKPEDKKIKLGFLQTPQSFYDPDVFQYALYAEKRIPNEQDFFYRTIEPSKTSSNSVIYGGSNTVIAREALEAAGGFFTESITEDIATGLLIQSKGFVSLAIPEPLASGQTPHTFKEHIKQRTRWGRGVIVTARKLRILTRKDISLAQKISYWSSVVYWYSPLKNLVYMLSPLLYAVLAVPVFRCDWLDLVVFWLPMFAFQDINLRLNSKNSISTKWSGIYETSVMPHLLLPVLKESVGITLKNFKVTDKSGRASVRQKDFRSMLPFIVLSVLSVAGIVRVVMSFKILQIIPTLILLFWIVRNLYFLIMSMFLIDGRDSDEEPVKVAFPEIVTVESDLGRMDGVTTLMTEHNLTVYLDEGAALTIGTPCTVALSNENITVNLKGVVTGVLSSRNSPAMTHTIEITDLDGKEHEYWQILYDRVPTLPQSLSRDTGLFRYLWTNIARRLAGTARA